MPPTEGDPLPNFEVPICNGGTFRSQSLHETVNDGGVIVFFGFAFSAIAVNWWNRYEHYGWDEFDVPVVGVCRDGPYALNAFIRYRDIPFRMFSDTNGVASESFDLLTERDGMANTSTPWRAVYVTDGDEITYRWIADDWISPVPRDEAEAAVAELTGEA